MCRGCKFADGARDGARDDRAKDQGDEDRTERTEKNRIVEAAQEITLE